MTRALRGDPLQYVKPAALSGCKVPRAPPLREKRGSDTRWSSLLAATAATCRLRSSPALRLGEGRGIPGEVAALEGICTALVEARLGLTAVHHC